MTIVSRLHEKHILRRDKSGRQFLYSLAKKADEVKSGVWSTVYSALFQNDRLKPILALIDDSDELSAEDLRELKRLVDSRLKQIGNDAP